MLSSRLLNASLFASAAGRSALSAAIASILPFDSPYIVAGTPLLYPYVEDTTSVTPAWRTSLWHISISRPNIILIIIFELSTMIQFTIEGRFYFNSTLDERLSQYAQVNQHIQVFRDLTQGSGAYFVRLSRQDRDTLPSFFVPERSDVYEPDHEQSFWGHNYNRLLQVKQK